MLRRSGAAVAALALVCGSLASPYTHAHYAIDSVSDERHARGNTLVHTHASPHSRHDADHPDPEPGKEDSGEHIWSVDAFVFQLSAPSKAPSPALLAVGAPLVELSCIWFGADRPQPRAHGPPAASHSALRGPPTFPPRFV